MMKLILKIKSPIVRLLMTREQTWPPSNPFRRTLHFVHWTFSDLVFFWHISHFASYSDYFDILSKIFTYMNFFVTAEADSNWLGLFVKEIIKTSLHYIVRLCQRNSLNFHHFSFWNVCQNLLSKDPQFPNTKWQKLKFPAQVIRLDLAARGSFFLLICQLFPRFRYKLPFAYI